MKIVSVTRIAAGVTAVVCASAPGAHTEGLETRARASMAVFTPATFSAAPAVKAVLGSASETICRPPWDAAVTDAEALLSVEAKARAMGANGLVNVTFDRRRTDLKAPCWQRLNVQATAVVFEATKATRTSDAR